MGAYFKTADTIRYAPLFEEKIPVTTQGLGSLGESQAAYDRLTGLQNQFITMGAGLFGIGKDLWDTVAGAIYRSGKVPAQIVGGYFPGFDWASGEYRRVYDLIKSHTAFPSVSDMALADQRVAEFNSMIAYAKGVVPEIQAKVTADQAEMKAKLDAMPPVPSPSAVGWETFTTEVEKRTAALTSNLEFGAGLGVVALAALAVLYFMGRR